MTEPYDPTGRTDRYGWALFFAYSFPPGSTKYPHQNQVPAGCCDTYWYADSILEVCPFCGGIPEYRPRRTSQVPAWVF